MSNSARCRYVGSSALQQLGGGFQAAGESLQHFAEIWNEELEAASPDPEKPSAAAQPPAAAEDDNETRRGLLRLEKGILQKRIAGPLGKALVLFLHGLSLSVVQDFRVSQACQDR